MGSRNPSIYLWLVEAGSRLGPLKQVHGRILAAGLGSSRSLLTKLAALAAAGPPPGGVAYALSLLPHVPSPDSFLFNSLIRAAGHGGAAAAALGLYRRMRCARLPCSSFTFTAAAKAAAAAASRRPGRQLHAHLVLLGLSADAHAAAAFVSLYGKCGDVAAARRVFDGMPDRSVVAWNAMIAAYEQNGLAAEAVAVFREMVNARRPDAATLVSLLSACGQLGDLATGRWAVGWAAAEGIAGGAASGGAAVTMFARCGCLAEAREVFDRLRRPNVVTWTAMISGYGMHGGGAAAVELFREMAARGPPPNSVTFVAVLSACAHAGLVKQGEEIFLSMARDYGVEPRMEHVVCMVDMLGRVGKLGEAFEFLRRHGGGGVAAMTALAGACKRHRRLDLGAAAATELIAMEPENPAHYVLLSNLYAQAGRMGEVAAVRAAMAGRGLKKTTGYSSVEASGVTHVFLMGDRAHPRAAEIRRFLEGLMGRIRDMGYVPETAEAMHEVEEEEAVESALGLHSEKLAVAFGIMSSGEGEPVRVTKNLRMCGDCHSAIKFISAAVRREIIVRDVHRFHRFQDGSCSCSDFW
ncbi:pentatricopeptide repeat-containing protein At2g33760-like [Wolffia australiana]